MRDAYRPLILSIILGSVFLVLGQSCHSSRSVEAKNLTLDTDFPYEIKPIQSYTMPQELEEISGITMLKEFPETLFAIQDEEGLLFAYDVVRQQVISKSKFAGKGDYEDITTDGHFFYVLRSDGVIFRFPVSKEPDLKQVKRLNGLLPKGEYESIAYDREANKVVVLCKECEIDRKKFQTTGYTYHVTAEGDLVAEKTFVIDTGLLHKWDKTMSKTFKPSAIARNHLSKEWYVLSSIDRAILVLDDAFMPKNLTRFERKAFEQAEGMVFDTAGDRLYIASEAGRQSHGMIYQLKKR